MKALRLEQLLAIFLVIAGHSTGHGQAPVAGAGAAQTDGARPPNRLAREKSPYLLQHAHNPVDWYPWGAEALERAKKEGKPIFLSIGYATCHWCHVMERESFENPVIAAFLNASFVAIKVDREERPDIDAVYMAACLAQTGNGGWPLTAVLTPEGKPFFVGTYFPPEDDPRRGRGLLTILKQIEKLWREDRQNLEKHAEHFTETLRRESNVEGARKTLGWPAVRRAYQRFRDQFDDARGGFGQAPRFAPKFPRTVVLDLLLAYSATREARESDTSSPALQMVLSTLEAMSRGGIRDHLGGGFHRYSTDRQWLVPHFEKMLYDQALIARTLVGAWRQTRSQPLLQATRETLDYALRRLRAPGGAFYSAEDADTEGVEGKTYVWDRGEILQALGEEPGGRFAEIYGVTAAGNFHDAGPGLNVLSQALEGGEAELARKLGRPADEIGAELSRSRARLLEIRDRRPQPRLDDKVLTEWNGLMISALSHAAQVTQEERYRAAARQAAGFLLENLVRDGRLLRRWREGEASVGAFLEDHAAFAEGLIDLYETTFEIRWLEAAVQLAERMLEEFWDEADGAFFSSGQRNEVLIARAKEFYDGALPAGNSVALHVLLRLGSLTEKERFRTASSRLLETAGLLLDRDDESPTSRPYLLAGGLRALSGAREIVIVGAPGDPRANELLLEAQARYLPGRVLVLAQSAEEVERLKSLVPLVEGRWPADGKAAAYVCRDGVCKLPARDREGFLRALAE